MVLAATQAVAAPRTSSLPAFGPTTSLLVVAPHPDDETLCCAGVIQRVTRAGGRVSVVWITSGDGSELSMLVVEKSLFSRPEKQRELGARRMQEARSVAAILGIAPQRLFFLGYPDRGVLPLLTDYYITPYHSKPSGMASVPYAEALFPGHPYTGQSLERDFEWVLEHVRPTLVLAPSPRDSHPDHRATGILTLRGLGHRDELASARYWIVHGGKGWPAPSGLAPEAALTPSPHSAGLAPTSFTLEPAEEERKLQAVRAYHTQMEVMAPILLSFVRTTELFSVSPMP